MLHQRKRFNYLSTQQRALNSSNIAQNDKATFNSRIGSIVSSHSKSQNDQQYHHGTQSYTAVNRNSSGKKQFNPIIQFNQNIPFLDAKPSVSKVLTTSNKENLNLSITKQSGKDSKVIFPYSNTSNISQLQTKVKQLQTQNSLLLKQFEQKFLQMENHLEKVQSILKEKQTVIENLTMQNKRLNYQKEQILTSNLQLNDQKQQLLRMIADKNTQITNLNCEIQNFSIRQNQLSTILQLLNQQKEKFSFQFKQLVVQPLKVYQESDTQTQSSEQLNDHQPPSKQLSTVNLQTDLRQSEIEQMIQRYRELEVDSKINYRQKYESLFKKALEMEDEIYKLKEELFDSQSQVKTIEQQFNTYKIFNQIEKINHK